MIGITTGAQLLFSNFDTHSPSMPSGINCYAKSESGEILLEQEFSNDERLSKKELCIAAGAAFQAEVDKFLRAA